MANETVAVLGAGSTMGRAIARNMAGAGIPVRAWNRTRDKAEPLAGDGAQVLDTPAVAVAGATMLLTMLADADAVLASVEDALAGDARDIVWLQMSTIGERGTERCIDLAREREMSFIDAPVLGSKQPAEEGKLIVLASGSQELRNRSQPIFDAIAQKTMWIAERPGAGTRLKIAANSWVLTVTEGCAETIALAQGLGLDPSLLFEAFAAGTLDLPYFRIKGQAILERKFDPTFRLALAAKDASLIERSADDHGLDLPLFAAISKLGAIGGASAALRKRMQDGARTHGDKDMSATWFASAPGPEAA